VNWSRREVTGAGAAAILAGCVTGGNTVEDELFGMIGQMKSVPGKRDELIGYLLEGSGQMPGNLVYIVAKDAADPDAVWITEVWRSKADHAASLSLPQVRDAIARARPIIADFGLSAETIPVGFTA
jgi:quinol monooxygenase YgiN